MQLYEMLGAQLQDATRTFKLLQSSTAPPDEAQRLGVALTELSNSLEELRAACDELQRQNGDLVSAREDAELERKRYQDLFELAPDAYLVTSLDGTIREANKAAACLLGVEPAKLVGKPLTVFVPEGHRSVFRERINLLADQGGVAPWETTIQPRQPKGIVQVEMRAAAGIDPGDRQPILRWLIRDLSDTRRLRSQLVEMDDKLWMRVAERTAWLTQENDRLKAQLAARAGSRSQAGGAATSPNRGMV